MFASFHIVNTIIVAISSNQCDVTGSRVGKSYAVDSIIQYFHHTEIIVVKFKIVDKNKM